MTTLTGGKAKDSFPLPMRAHIAPSQPGSEDTIEALSRPLESAFGAVQYTEKLVQGTGAAPQSRATQGRLPSMRFSRS